MVKIIPAQDVNLRYLIDNVGLEYVRDTAFFPEWQNDLPELTDLDRQLLDRVRDGFFNLMERPPLLEDVVRMAVVDPILFIGGFFLYPFYIRSEEAVTIEIADRDVIIKGRIDTLVLKDQFWMMVIESKKAEFSIEAGLAQILAYMQGNPHPERPSYGMITTGGSFIFLKLVAGNPPRYATSKGFFTRNPGNELYEMLRILKRLTQIAISD